MITPLTWSVFWPTQLPVALYQDLILAQTDIENSQILLTNTYPSSLYARLIFEKSHLCTDILLKMELKSDFLNKKYRNKTQDDLCFLADQYWHERVSKLNLLFLPNISLDNIDDFNKYLMDIMFFFKERFSFKIPNIALTTEASNYSFVDHINFFKLALGSNICNFGYSPLYFEKLGFDSLKTSFIWKPYVNTIYLSDVNFDGKTHVSPGEGMVPNQSICQIALEKKQAISFIFRPNIEMIKTKNAPFEYLTKCETFMKKLR